MPNADSVQQRLRRCNQCGSIMRQIAGEDGWTNLFEQKQSPRYQCCSCGHEIELFDHTSFVCAILVGTAAILAVVFYDAHLFWLFVELFSRPVHSFEQILKDGPFAVILILLGLTLVVFLLVILPVMALGYALRTVVTRLQNPILAHQRVANLRQKSSAAQRAGRHTGALAGALIIALAVNAFLGAALLVTFGFGGGRDAVESLMEGVLPPSFFLGGLLFGFQRWLVGLLAFLLLPVTGFLVYLAQ